MNEYEKKEVTHDLSMNRVGFFTLGFCSGMIFITILFVIGGKL